MSGINFTPRSRERLWISKGGFFKENKFFDDSIYLMIYTIIEAEGDAYAKKE